MPITLRKQLGGAWETIRGFLKDDLDMIEMELNLPTDLSEVEGTLPISVMPEMTASTLLGRGSANGTGPAEEIDLGTGLVMDGTTLRVDPAILTAARGPVRQSGGNGSSVVLRGPQGVPGGPGPAGPRGRAGADGERGPAGPAGSGGSFSRTTLYWSLLTNGDTIEPELVFDGAGDVIWVNL